MESPPEPVRRRCASLTYESTLILFGVRSSGSTSDLGSVEVT
jgi:hypothetical protein